MNVQVTITHELGESVKSFIGALINANGGNAAAGVSSAKSEKAAPKEQRAAAPANEEPETAPRGRRGRPSATPSEPEDDAPRGRGRRMPAAESEDDAPKTRGRGRGPAAESEPEEVETLESVTARFAKLPKDKQLDEIKAKITLITKKKGGADDARELLGVFDAGRASELEASDYVEFFGVLWRYRNGESVDQIFPQID